MNKPMSARPAGTVTPIEDQLAKVRGIIDEAPASTPAVEQGAEPAPRDEGSKDWRVLPKKVQTTQFNVRIRADLYEVLKELATYTDGESMTSIAARGIEKEIIRMLRERGDQLTRE